MQLWEALLNREDCQHTCGKKGSKEWVRSSEDCLFSSIDCWVILVVGAGRLIRAIELPVESGAAEQGCE